MNNSYDVAIIGAGVIGAGVARELSRYNLKVVVIEKCEEISSGASKANSGIVHAGFDAKPNTLKAKFNLLGSKLFEEIERELDVPYRQNGALVINFDESLSANVNKLYEQGVKNGVEELHVLDSKEVYELEPNIRGGVYNALYAPTSAITTPYELVIGYAENALENGVEFLLDTEVVNIESMKTGGNVAGARGREGEGAEASAREGEATLTSGRESAGESEGYILSTSKGDIRAKVVVNAAGVYADEMNNFVSSTKYKVVPRKGEYIVLDRTTSDFITRTTFQLPSERGKGVLLTPTIHGNLMLGPTSYETGDKNATYTTFEGLSKVIDKARLTSENIPLHKTINSFAGLRANVQDTDDDFIINTPADAPNFINALNINSPGLSAAPAIAQYISKHISDMLNAEKNSAFNPIRKGIVTFQDKSSTERKELVRENPDYAEMICPCETITKAEVEDSINRKLGATTLGGIKQRTRVTMGICQGSYCRAKVLHLLSMQAPE